MRSTPSLIVQCRPFLYEYLDLSLADTFIIISRIPPPSSHDNSFGNERMNELRYNESENLHAWYSFNLLAHKFERIELNRMDK